MSQLLLFSGDCLDVMKNFKDCSVDFILADLPYGKTACHWDVVIPFEPLWEQYKRIIKPRGAIALFGSEPFASHLRLSNLKWYKYDWVWHKSIPGNFFNAKLRPMSIYETVSVFSCGKTSNRNSTNMRYFPQGLVEVNVIRNGIKKGGADDEHRYQRKSHKKKNLQKYTNYPTNILKFKHGNAKIEHATGKSVPLLEYLINTYTLEGETVLDNCMGSGSTGVACKNLNRNFIGIEKDDRYFQVAKERIERHTAQIQLKY